MTDERSRWKHSGKPVEQVFDRLDNGSGGDVRDDDLAAHAEYLRQLVDQLPAFLWMIPDEGRDSGSRRSTASFASIRERSRWTRRSAKARP